jgi:hypothetical protein
MEMALRIGGWRFFKSFLNPEEVARRLIGVADISGLCASLPGSSSQGGPMELEGPTKVPLTSFPTSEYSSSLNMVKEQGQSVILPSRLLQPEKGPQKPTPDTGNDPPSVDTLVKEMLSNWTWDEETKGVLSMVNDRGHTLAHICAMGNYVGLITYLVQCGIDLAKTDKGGRSPADLATFFQLHVFFACYTSRRSHNTCPLECSVKL